MNPPGIGFCVLYRFDVREGAEAEFRDAWHRLTEIIRDHSGGLGSRLHRADDGSYVAYAQWPSRAAWEASRAAESPDPEAFERMAACITGRHEPLLLEPVADLLEPA